MESLIAKIIEIDKAAVKRIEQAEEKKQKVIQSLSKQKGALAAEAEAQTKEALAAFEDKQRQNADRALAAIAENEKKLLDQLDSAYAARHDDWEAELFARVTSLGCTG